MKFICPKCRTSFSLMENRSIKCKNNHSFDRSREGYYNLLLSGGGVHGDNREMLLARRDFLNTGAYLPLAERVAELVINHTEDKAVLLDGGCGEGYYTHIIAENAKNVNKSLHILGFDISKEAVRLAAKRETNFELAVASSYDIPLPDSCVDTFVNIFSPLAIEETRRVLKSGGTFIMAIPGEEHLFGLKALLYDTPYKNEPFDFGLSGFTLLDKSHIKYGLNLDSEEKIQSLFAMTPYRYRTAPERIERLKLLKNLDTAVEFFVLCYKKV